MSNRPVSGIGAAAVLFAAVCVNRAAAAHEIDLRGFARAPALALATLSPDGTFLSFLEQSGERQAVVLRTLRDGRQLRTLDVESKRERVRWCGWVASAHLLCGTIVPVRATGRVSEQTRLYAIDVADGRVRELNARSADPARDQVVDLVASRPYHVLLQYDAAGRGYPEVAELDVKSGGLRRVVRSHPPVRRWMSDGRGEVRLGIGYDAGGAASLHVRRPGSEGWTVFLEQSLADPEAVGPIAFGAQPEDLYVLKYHNGRSALFRLDLAERTAPRLLFAHDTYDVAGPVLLDPRTRALLAVQYMAQHEQLHFFDEAQAARQAWLDRQLPGAVNLVAGRTADGRRLLVRSVSDVNPPSLHLLDIDEPRLTLVGHEYPELEDQPLAPARPMTYRARDGQIIPAYLTLPLQVSSAGLPAIVLPHGGPEARDVKTFDPLVQFLAAQGYAVLQMNFRGSHGYGARFAAAGVGQWGGVIHNDITDGARWLVEQGIADPTRICIVGKSFGGYAALLGATRESQWYGCAVSYAALSDLIAFSQHTERLQGSELWKERLGGDHLALWQMSPLARVRTVEIPVLLIHGRNDAVVPFSQSQRFARALRVAGKPHRFIERVDCDHDLSIEACRVTFFSELRDFLASALALEE